MIKPRSQRIKDIRKKFRKRREWLLIAVDKIDESKTQALTGRLLAHSPHQDEILKKSISYRGIAMIDYSEDSLPKNTALIFHVKHGKISH